MKKNKVLMIALLIIVLVLIVFTIYVVANDSNKGQMKKTSTSSVSSDLIKLGDKMFITTLNDIYTNTEDYEGKKIIVEGFPLTDSDYTFVSRYGPGCCSSDVYAFLEYVYPEKLDLADEKDWIRVEGTLKQGYENNQAYVYIEATKVEKLNTRGKDTVID